MLPASHHQPKPVVELSTRERNHYSIVRAINAAARGSTCFELEVSDEIKRTLQLSTTGGHGGFFMPTLLARSGLDTKTSTKGSELVFTEPGSFIEALHNRTLVLSLGAQLIPGLVGNVDFPKLIGSAEAEWLTENPGSDANETTPTLDVASLRLKTLVGRVKFSRQLLAQSTPKVDQVVTDDLARVSAVALDKAAIHGSGVAPVPAGIYASATGVTDVDFGGPVSFPKVVAMETTIADANGETGEIAYMTTPKVREAAKLTLRGTGFSNAIWMDDGKMNGRRAEATKQIAETLGGGAEHGIIAGVWSELFVGEWGALEIIVDRVTLAQRGMIDLTTFLYADTTVRHKESFAKGTGLTLS